MSKSKTAESFDQIDDMLAGYGCVIREAASSELERFDYLPSVETALTNFRAMREAYDAMLQALRGALGTMKLQRDVIEKGQYAHAWKHPIDAIEAALSAAKEQQP
jgi:hypothetical protein